MTELWRTSRPLLRQLSQVRAVLFDRDDTLILDIPRFSGDPSRVTPLPGAQRAVARLRAAGLRLGVVSNQSGMGRGMLSIEQVEAVNRRVEELLGKMDTWRYCPHTALDPCTCRTPGPKLVIQAAIDLGVSTDQIVVVGDAGTDMMAAQSAGSVGILVPSSRTTMVEIRQAALVVPNLDRVAEMVITARSSRRQPVSLAAHGSRSPWRPSVGERAAGRSPGSRAAGRPFGGQLCVGGPRASGCFGSGLSGLSR